MLRLGSYREAIYSFDETIRTNPDYNDAYEGRLRAITILKQEDIKVESVSDLLVLVEQSNIDSKDLQLVLMQVINLEQRQTDIGLSGNGGDFE